jgi:hypothetical protein
VANKNGTYLSTMTKYLHKTHRKKNPQTIAQKGSKPISEAGS